MKKYRSSDQRRPLYWHILPYDVVRTIVDPRHQGVVVQIHGTVATVRWDNSAWLEHIHVDNLERTAR
jgi:hypothetical protein